MNLSKKACANCGKEFQPTGPRSSLCADCKAAQENAPKEKPIHVKAEEAKLPGSKHTYKEVDSMTFQEMKDEINRLRKSLISIIEAVDRF